MAGLPYESLLGVAYGLLTGLVPALWVGLAAVGVGLTVDRRLPLLAGSVLVILTATALGAAVGVLALPPDPSGTIRLAMVVTVAGLLGVVATGQGNRIAADLPRGRTAPTVRGRTLSADAIDAVDAAGQVTIRPTGAIREFEGHPPLSPPLRTVLEDGAWRFPADLQLAELERRLERRLRTDFALSRVEVSIDGRGRATITAAPPAKGLARALPAGTRAMTVAGLLPTGIEPGDRVAIGTPDATVRGDVLAVHDERDGTAVPDEGDADVVSAGRRSADLGADGGEGRLTVAVDPAAAGRLLEADRHRIAVLPSDDNREFVAATLLEAAGRPVTELDPSGNGAVDPASVLGTWRDGAWRFATDEPPEVDAERAFVAGSPDEVSG